MIFRHFKRADVRRVLVLCCVFVLSAPLTENGYTQLSSKLSPSLFRRAQNQNDLVKVFYGNRLLRPCFSECAKHSCERSTPATRVKTFLRARNQWTPQTPTPTLSFLSPPHTRAHPLTHTGVRQPQRRPPGGSQGRQSARPGSPP